MMSPRRRLAPEERRRLIVEAAGRLFGERGYDGTRLDGVAAAAGVTKPVLYRHFADKTALYLALLERHRADLGSFAGAIPAEGPLEVRLRAVLAVWLDYVQAHSYAWRMLFRDTGGGEEVRAFRGEVHAEARAAPARLEHRQPGGGEQRDHVVRGARDQPRLGAAVAVAHRVRAGAEHEGADQDHAEQQHELDRDPAGLHHAPLGGEPEQHARGERGQAER